MRACVLIISMSILIVTDYAYGAGLVEWVKGSKTCSEICKTRNIHPVNSGFRVRKNESVHYYVCSFNMGNRGQRPGFLYGSEERCIVGTGGTSKKNVENKSCLCSTNPRELDWRSGSSLCEKACGDMEPVITGYISGSPHRAKAYHICRTNAWGDGKRSGYAITGSDKCVTGSGEDSVYVSSDKECLCKPKRKRAKAEKIHMRNPKEISNAFIKKRYAEKNPRIYDKPELGIVGIYGVATRSSDNISLNIQNSGTRGADVEAYCEIDCPERKRIDFKGELRITPLTIAEYWLRVNDHCLVSKGKSYAVSCYIDPNNSIDEMSESAPNTFSQTLRW